MAAIEVENITKQFGAFTAVDAVSFTVARVFGNPAVVVNAEASSRAVRAVRSSLVRVRNRIMRPLSYGRQDRACVQQALARRPGPGPGQHGAADLDRAGDALGLD